jgi:predicted ATPase
VDSTSKRSRRLLLALQGGGDLQRDEILGLLTLLVDKSLALAESEDTHTRYRLLETVRQYALSN